MRAVLLKINTFDTVFINQCTTIGSFYFTICSFFFPSLLAYYKGTLQKSYMTASFCRFTATRKRKY